MTAKSTLKLFYALWPDAATRQALSRLQAAVPGKKTRPENLHLTLAFLGEQAPSALPVLRKILYDLPACDVALTIDRYGHFPRARVAWAGMSVVPQALFSLQSQLAQRLTEQHIAFDAQPVFTPHVTLVRNVPAPAMPRDVSFAPIVWHARTVALVESVSHPDGVRYGVLYSHG